MPFIAPVSIIHTSKLRDLVIYIVINLQFSKRLTPGAVVPDPNLRSHTNHCPGGPFKSVLI
jgi:hypothetical protein